MFLRIFEELNIDQSDMNWELLKENVKDLLKAGWNQKNKINGSYPILESEE